MKVLIRARAVLTMDGPGLGVIENAGVYIEDGIIQRVGRIEEVLKDGYKDDYYLDVRDYGVVMPGFYDVHMHTALSLFRGLANDVPESEWMEKCLSPFRDNLEWRHVKAGTLLGILEAVKSGTVVLGEYSPFLPKQIKEIYSKYGLKVFGTYMFNTLTAPMYEVSGKLYPLDPEIGYKKLDETDLLIKRYRDDENILIAYGPQAFDMVPLEVVKDAFIRAKKNDTFIHMHVAQGGRERRQMMMRYGFSTVMLMYKENLFNHRLLATHLHDSTDDELRLVARSGASMVSCQRSIVAIDGVIPPMARFLEYGGNVLLGTDNVPGPGNQSMFAELKFIAFFSKIYMGDPSYMPPWKLLKMATANAADTLKKFRNGRVKEGCKADIIVLDLKRINTLPVISRPIRNFISHIVYSTYGNEVSHVFIDGEPFVENYRLTKIDEEDVLKEVQSAAEDLADKIGYRYIETGNTLVKAFMNNLF